MEAEGLVVDQKGDTCNSYVKVGLVPNRDARTLRRTKTVPDCRNPVYQETFVFAMGDEERYERLLVTMWHSDRHTPRKLVGCMSFGVRSLNNPEKFFQQLPLRFRLQFRFWLQP
ncbi:regulator of G-protein signaling 3-like [Alosa sapidissima]|uniref:regulator of G-protein signaling 3-like n=1 Tax=Alosa sapidissima TaxID=34773 RepID=UPI001C097654|nr:regulator of G-protein signaling 3-like [Alosa sapidissima]